MASALIWYRALIANAMMHTTHQYFLDLLLLGVTTGTGLASGGENVQLTAFKTDMSSIAISLP